MHINIDMKTARVTDGPRRAVPRLASALTLLTVSLACSQMSMPVEGAQNSPKYVYPTDHIYAYLDPQRPSDASKLRIANGVVENFGYNDVPPFMLLAIRTQGSVLHYFVSSAATINGERLQCGSSVVVAGRKLCKTIPILAPGTTVALLWWSPGISGWDNVLATDAIVIVSAQ